MAYFFQWLWWQSDDPIADALNGKHVIAPAKDMVKALGSLRRRLRQIHGDDHLEGAGEEWFEMCVHEGFEDIPGFELTKPATRQRRKGPGPGN